MERHLENLNLKIFEDKYEKNAETIWAKSTFDPMMYHALQALSNRKVAKVISYKEAQRFFSGHQVMAKEVFSIGKKMKANTINYLQVFDKLETITLNGGGFGPPTTFTRIFFEKLFFPEFDDPKCNNLRPNDHLFFGIP